MVDLVSPLTPIEYKYIFRLAFGYVTRTCDKILKLLWWKNEMTNYGKRWILYK